MRTHGRLESAARLRFFQFCPVKLNKARRVHLLIKHIQHGLMFSHGLIKRRKPSDPQP